MYGQLIKIFALLCIMLPAVATAQNTSEEIVMMKLDKNFLSEESTNASEVKARDNADLLLISRITDYFEKNLPGKTLTPEVLQNIQHMSMKRGEHTRVLSYIAIAALTGEAPAAKPADTAKDAAKPTPTEKPKETATAKPKEEPVKPETKKQPETKPAAPKTTPAKESEENTKNDSVDEIYKIKIDKNYLSEESTNSSGTKAQEVADNLLIIRITRYLKDNFPDRTLSPDILQLFKHLSKKKANGYTLVLSYIPISDINRLATKETPKDTSMPQWKMDVINEIVYAKDINEANSLLNLFKSLGKVSRYGIVTNCPDRNAAFWVIGNRGEGIKAVLGPGTDSRRDYSTNQTSSLDNFKGSPALWFEFND